MEQYTQAQPTGASPGKIISARPLILIVEDERPVREVEARILGQHYNVMTAVDGIDALPIIEESRPDMLLSDVIMPNMDGVQLFRAVRQRYEGTGYDPKFLFATGNDFDRLLRLDGAPYSSFMKPLGMEPMLALVAETLAGRYKVTHDDYLKDIEKRLFGPFELFRLW